MVWAKLAAMAGAFGQTAVRRDGSIPDRLTRTWVMAQSRLPEGWILSGLRCDLTDLATESHSDDWVATAVGPAGEQREHLASDAVSALDGLADSFAT